MVKKEIISSILDDSFQKYKVKCKPGYVAPARLLNNFIKKDKENYQQEEYSPDQDPNNLKGEDYFVSPVGKLQKIQEDLQLREKDNLDWFERKSIEEYGASTFIPVNDYLYQKENYEKAVYPVKEDGTYDYEHPLEDYYLGNPYGDPRLATVPELIDLMDKAIEKMPPLQYDTCVYRWGEFPDDLKTGDKGVFKGYTSTSFNPYVAEEDIKRVGNGKWMKDNRKVMRIWCPAGTKGCVMDSNTFLTNDWQSEWLIGRNQKYIVVSNSKDVVDILLY